MIKQQETHILSSVYGSISKLLLVYHSDIKDVFFDLLYELNEKLHPHTKIVIWADDATAKRELIEEISTWDNVSYNLRKKDGEAIEKEDSQSRFYIIPDPDPDDDRDSCWVQDAFVVVKIRDQEDAIGLVETIGTIAPKSNRHLADNLGDIGYCQHLENHNWFCFQAGNILVGDNFLLIGKDDFEQTKQELINDGYIGVGVNKRESDDITKSRICDLLGVEEVIPIGYKNQMCTEFTLGRDPLFKGQKAHSDQESWHPFPHIDQFVSIVGNNSLFGRPIIMVAKLTPLFKGHPKLMKYADSFNFYLDEIVRELAPYGFEIIRNNVPLFMHDGSVRCTYYNNCLVEITENSKTVWIPSYADRNIAFEPFEELNKEAWEVFGFEVVFVEKLFPFCLAGGSLHCITKCLQREELNFVTS